MMVTRSIAFSLSLSFGAAVYAAPAPVTDANANSLEKRIATLERMVKSRASMQQRIQVQLDTMQDEVNELRGTLESHNHQLEQILQRQRELYLEIDKRIEAVMSQAPAPKDTTPAAETGANNYVLTGSESEAYERAVNLILKDKQYEQAIPEFHTFLQNFPNSSYAPNAHYWLGQLLFNKQDWAGAGEQFQILVSGYPDSGKRPDALFKLGVVEQKRNNLARAKQLFEQVIAQYPDSSSKKLAETRLRNLK